MVARFRIALAETSSLRIMELQLAGSRCEQIMLLRLVCFGLCPCQHNGTYTRNVYPATPTKTPAKILHFAESKSEPLSRKNSGKAAQNALGKGTSPLILPKPFWISFFTTSKIGRKKPGSRWLFGHFLYACLLRHPRRNSRLRSERKTRCVFCSLRQFSKH